MAKYTNDELLEAFGEMTLVELSEFVKAFELYRGEFHRAARKGKLPSDHAPVIVDLDVAPDGDADALADAVLAAATDPITLTVALLAQGKIIAIKDPGGYHLVCDAHNRQAVNGLRERKQREEKPFAIMVANVASLAGLVEISDTEKAEMASAARPIVLLRKCAPVGASEAGEQGGPQKARPFARQGGCRVDKRSASTPVMLKGGCAFAYPPYEERSGAQPDRASQ